MGSGKLGTHLGNSPGALAELQQAAATVAAPPTALELSRYSLR